MSYEFVPIDGCAELQRTERVPLDQNPAAVYVASLAPGSRRAIRTALNTVSGMLTSGACDMLTMSWGELRFQHVAAVRSRLAEEFAPATANRALSAIRGVLKCAWRLGQIPTEEFQRAIDHETIRGETLPRGRSLSTGEIRGLFLACADDPSNFRNRDSALLSVLYGAGLRRSEVVALDVADYDTESGALAIRHGKGNKARICYATNGSKAAIDSWMLVRGGEPGPVFVAMVKGGELTNRRLTDQALAAVVKKRMNQTGVQGASCHSFRRSFVGDLLDAGADISTVQKLAGHSSVTTTTRYDRRGEIAKRKATELLHVPFVSG